MRFIINVLTRLLKTIIKLSLYFAIFATIIVLIPNLPPYSKFTKVEISPSQPRVGPLAPNEILNNAEKLYKGKLLGPEAFQIYKGELYTSLATGEIVKLSPGGHITFVTTVGQPCSGLTKEHICGRPLGFQIDDKDNSLYVADAYHGVWKVDLKTDKKQLLVSPRVEIENRLPKLFNSIALGKNGDFYWTDSTSDFNLKDGAMGMLTDPSGRLFHYDAAKNQSKVLLDDLWFANGVVLSPNNDFVVVAESTRSKLSKYYVAGPKKGKSEVFVDGLPGAPDNMRVLPDGSGILVGLYTVYSDDHPVITRSLAPTPVIRKFLARLQRLIEIPFEYLNNLYPHVVFEEIVYHIGHFKSVSGLTSAMPGLVQVDWNGNIVAAYYNTDGTLSHISDAIVYNNKLYMGCPHVQDFVGAVPVPTLLKKAFEPSKKPEAAKVETKSQEAKPVQQTPKQKTVEQPKAKVEEKPSMETKPKAEPKPIGNKPKITENKEAPKVVKPVASAPKPVQQPKPAEPPKQAQKPTARKTSEDPPEVSQKEPTPSKPTSSGAKVEQTKKATQTEPKPTTPKPTTPKPTTPKPEVKQTPPPKATEKNTPPAPKPITSKPKETSEASKKNQPPGKQDTAKTTQSPKPIKEEIPSDTVKPTKETLKVIKKDGPTEMPVPNQ